MRRRTKKKKKTEVDTRGGRLALGGGRTNPKAMGVVLPPPDRPVVGHRLSLCSLCFMNNDDTLDERVIGFVLEKINASFFSGSIMYLSCSGLFL
jgi:hypothetical protein